LNDFSHASTSASVTDEQPSDDVHLTPTSSTCTSVASELQSTVVPDDPSLHDLYNDAATKNVGTQCCMEPRYDIKKPVEPPVVVWQGESLLS